MRLFGSRKHGGGAPADPRDVYLGLRRQALGITAGALGATLDSPLLALLMETGMSGAVVTLVAAADGTTSMYTSTGGGVLGAGARREVAEAARQFLETGGRLLGELSPVSDPALPPQGTVQFVAVTADGLLGAVASGAELGERRHALSPLFYAAHGVITQIRLSQAA